MGLRPGIEQGLMYAAMTIEQDARAEWRELCQNIRPGVEPEHDRTALAAWADFWQPVVDRKIKALRKPYDQETDVCSTTHCKCQPECATPQQDFLEVPESVIYVLEDLRDDIKRKDNQIDNQVEIIGEWRKRALKAEHSLVEVDEYCNSLQSSMHEMGRKLRGANREDVGQREWDLFHFQQKTRDLQYKLDELPKWEEIASNRLAVIDEYDLRLKNQADTIRQAQAASKELHLGLTGHYLSSSDEEVPF